MKIVGAGDPPKKASVLIVDDEQQHGQLLTTILRRDFDPYYASSGADALALAHVIQFAVCLVDYRMPGMSGTDFLRELAKIQPDCIRFLVTAYGDSGVLGRAINEAHVYRYIAKPIDPDQLRLDLQRAVEHQQATAALVRARSMTLVGSLVSSVIHDLRNYLVLLRSAPEVIESPAGADLHEVADRLRYVDRSITDLTSELLALARGRAPRYTRAPLSLAEIVEPAAHYIQHDPEFGDRTLRVIIEPELPPVAVARSRIDRLVGNLLRNAREATGPTGTITVHLRRADNAVELAISDDGEGIPPGIQDQIFDPMFTTKQASGGSGFGLAVCKAVMEGHGGSLRCHSEPGKGAAFIATFPLDAPA